MNNIPSTGLFKNFFCLANTLTCLVEEATGLSYVKMRVSTYFFPHIESKQITARVLEFSSESEEDLQLILMNKYVEVDRKIIEISSSKQISAPLCEKASSPEFPEPLNCVIWRTILSFCEHSSLLDLRLVNKWFVYNVDRLQFVRFKFILSTAEQQILKYWIDIALAESTITVLTKFIKEPKNKLMLPCIRSIKFPVMGFGVDYGKYIKASQKLLDQLGKKTSNLSNLSIIFNQIFEKDNEREKLLIMPSRLLNSLKSHKSLTFGNDCSAITKKRFEIYQVQISRNCINIKSPDFSLPFWTDYWKTLINCWTVYPSLKNLRLACKWLAYTIRMPQMDRFENILDRQIKVIAQKNDWIAYKKVFDNDEVCLVASFKRIQ